MKTDIVLFDLPTTKGIAQSANTWRVRLALNYKNLQYRTQWVPTSDIEKVIRPLGIRPTGIKPDGSPHWTLPAIVDHTDPTHPVVLSDSMIIVEYLERTYPASPGSELFPPNTKAFQVVLMQFVIPKLMGIIPDLLLGAMYAIKSPEEKIHFRNIWETRYGRPLESIERQGVDRETVFEKLKQDLALLSIAFQQNSEGSFLMGRQVSFADFAVASWLITVKVASPNDIWARIAALDEGRWGKYLEAFHDWMAVDKDDV